jgi:ankyrin repeat protein
MELLLNEYKVDINARAGLVNDGATPLFLAYKKGYDDSSEVVRFIKSRGGVSIDPGEQAPYKPASEHTPEELEQYNLKDFHLAAAKGDDIRVAQYVVARRDLVEATDENGWRAIHEAVRYGHRVTTQILINAGADINAVTANNDGWSPLALAIQRFGEDNAVTRLLRRHNAVAHFPRE